MLSPEAEGRVWHPARVRRLRSMLALIVSLLSAKLEIRDSNSSIEVDSTKRPSRRRSAPRSRTLLCGASMPHFRKRSVAHEHKALCGCNRSIGDRVATASHSGVTNATVSAVRVAISTLYAPSRQPCAGVGCGLLLWCSSARILQRSLAQVFAAVDLIAIMPAAASPAPTPMPAASLPSICDRFTDATESFDATDCPGLRIVRPRAEMISAAAQHVARRVQQLNQTVVRWTAIGPTRPTTGTELDSATLSAAIAQRLREWRERTGHNLTVVDFAETEASTLGLTGLHPDSYIRAASTYFSPSVALWFARKRDQVVRLGRTLW